MTLKKKYLTLFYKALAEAKSNVEENYISLADARIRDALATKSIYDILHEFEEARKKIYTEFAIEDEDGEPKLINDNFQFESKDVAKINEEVKILEEEEVEILIADPEKIKLFLNNTKYAPMVGEAIIIDEIINQIV